MILRKTGKDLIKSGWQVIKYIPGLRNEPADMRSEHILALIPAWNEATRIGPVVKETGHQLPVLVVDDGSSDETADVAAAAGAVIIRHDNKLGYGRALRTGFGWALKNGHHAVLTLDADGQHDPADIPKFLAAFRSGPWDLIIGRRNFRQVPFHRRYTTRFGSWLLQLALKQPVHDNSCGFRLYSRPLLEKLSFSTTGFELTAEAIILTAFGGHPIGWVDIQTIYDTGKKSNFRPVRDGYRFFATVGRAVRHRIKHGLSAGDGSWRS